MRYIKHISDISSNLYFYLLLGLLFLINLTIAGCFILFTLLLVGLIIHSLKTKKIPPVPGYYKYLLIYILLSLISTLFAIDKLHSLKDNKEFFVYLLIPIVLLIINSKKRLLYSLYAVTASALLSALIGLAQTVTAGGISLDNRLKGLTSHWMTYSGLLMFIFIFLFIYLFYEKRKNKRIAIVLTLCVILASILISQTRSVWVGLFISSGIFIIYYKPKILYIAVPGLIILFFLLPQSIKTRVTSIFDPENATNRDRVYMFSVGIKIFKDYPLTGVGPNNIEKVYDRYKPAQAELSNLHLHNNFLQVLAERGVPALLGLLAAFAAIFLQLVKKIKNSSDLKKRIALGSLFLFIGFLVSGLFEYNFGDAEIKFLLFYFLSIPFLTEENKNDDLQAS
ncbi:MAG: O-antigen ligase family protein [Candidatus Aminicenantes bacterium]|nr:O-antigen ligase family protein [Candidatus Aminicenantes bacterium]